MTGALKRIRPYVTTDAAIHVYRALIQPHFDYCCSVWDGLGQIQSCKIQKLQNRAARIVMQASYDASAGALFDVLHWDNLSSRRKKFKANLMFKILNGKAPTSSNIEAVGPPFFRVSKGELIKYSG